MRGRQNNAQGVLRPARRSRDKLRACTEGGRNDTDCRDSQRRPDRVRGRTAGQDYGSTPRTLRNHLDVLLEDFSQRTAVDDAMYLHTSVGAAGADVGGAAVGAGVDGEGAGFGFEHFFEGSRPQAGIVKAR